MAIGPRGIGGGGACAWSSSRGLCGAMGHRLLSRRFLDLASGFSWGVWRQNKTKSSATRPDRAARGCAALLLRGVFTKATPTTKGRAAPHSLPFIAPLLLISHQKTTVQDIYQ